MAQTQEGFAEHMTPEGVDPFGASGIIEGGNDDLTPANEGTPGEGGAAPIQDKQTQPTDAGQGNAPSVDGQGKSGEPTPQDFGFQTWEDAGKHFAGKDDVVGAIDQNLKKSYDELRPAFTKVTQELAELRRQNEVLMASLRTPSPQTQKPTIDPEALQELWLTDPQQAMFLTLKENPQVLRELMGGLPEIQKLNELEGLQEAERVVGSLRRTYTDFEQYEPKVQETLESLGDEAYLAANPVALEYIYRAHRAETLLKNVFEKVGRARVADMVTTQGNRGGLNLRGGGINPGATQAGGKVDVGQMRDIPAEDLEFLDPTRRMRTVR